MKLNADFSQRVVMRNSETAWTASPMAGVERKMLDRIGDEVARATTIVRFAPGSNFSPHIHDGGEEFIVLEGVFSDEHGDFPVGSYIRNPPTSRHTPRSEPGCTILVKLHQFDPADRTHVRLATDKMRAVSEVERPGVTTIPLYRDAHEDVRIEHWAPGAEVRLDRLGGAEVFVLEGGYSESGEAFERWDWLRLPPGAAAFATAGGISEIRRGSKGVGMM